MIADQRFGARLLLISSLQKAPPLFHHFIGDSPTGGSRLASGKKRKGGA
jgi:hypothetical protein